MNNLENLNERIDLAAAFRWTARLDMHEAVANHFSLAINDSGTKFLMNPNQVHFSKIKASDLLVIDANDRSTLEGTQCARHYRVGLAWSHSPPLPSRKMRNACSSNFFNCFGKFGR
jgi:ribulose-5-phosphate 4-epimerase/fuculose-1-phosphate aldolase